MTRSMKWALAAGRLVVFALAVTALFSAPSFAGSKQQPSQNGPDALWSVPRIDVTIKPGETKQIPVTLTATDDLDAGATRIVPALASNVQVSPTSTPQLRKGQTRTFMLTFSAPLDALPTTMEGVLQLRENEEKRRLGGNIAKPLPMTLKVVWPTFSDLTSGIGFSYPTFGSTGTIQGDSTNFGAAGTGTIYSIAFPTSSSPTPAIQYLVTVIGNTQYQSIRDWFIAYVDPDQLLLTSGAYVARQLPNGVKVLMLAGPVPDSYYRGPISEVFAMSPSTLSVITIGTSNDDTMRRDLGLSSTAILTGYVGILGTISVP